MKTDFHVVLTLYYERYGDQFRTDFDCDDFLYFCARIIPFIEYHGWTLQDFIQEYINE